MLKITDPAGKNGMPAVVVDCVENLKREHLLHEGLFRVNQFRASVE